MSVHYRYLFPRCGSSRHEAFFPSSRKLTRRHRTRLFSCADARGRISTTSPTSSRATATPRFDYGYRLTTSRQIFAAYLAECVGALDYPNFKSEVAEADPERAHIYMGVWTALHKLRGIRP
jgi:hypothetical protein